MQRRFVKSVLLAMSPMVLIARFSVGVASGQTFYSISTRDALLRTIDPTDASTVGGVIINLPGATIQGGAGLAAHPVTGQVWALLRLQGQDGRELVTINPLTGEAAAVGDTGHLFSAIAFSADGTTLYAVTDDFAPDPELLYALSQTDGSATLVCGLGRGSVGEALALNTDDGALYHTSGNETQIFEKIGDLGPATCGITDIPLNGDLLEATALTYWKEQGVFLSTGYEQLSRISLDGIVTLVGELDHESKGLAVVRDSDGDGVLDPIDGCRDDPTKIEPGACGCGVADTDGDDDGVPDCLDGCPDDPDKSDRGACGCGVADTDGDDDGVPDCLDGCPDDPDKSDRGACGCGVADADADGDGVPDCLDDCPDDADKTAVGACGCGVADTDADGDGSPDCLDQCPDDAGKTAPGQCGCAQPDSDADGDGVADCVDNCRDIPNPGQSDVDEDGIGDRCSLLAAALPCPENIEISAGAAGEVVVQYDPPAAEGNADNLTITADPPPGSAFPLGVTPVTITVTDRQTGETNTCSFTVTVVPGPVSPLALVPLLLLCGSGVLPVMSLTMMGLLGMRVRRRRARAD